MGMNIFLGYSFLPPDRPIAADVMALIETHGARVFTGENLGGESLTPAIKARIEESDALVALFTPRDKKPNGRYGPPPWVRDELNHARSLTKPAIAIVDERIDVEPGMFQGHEYIPYKRKAPLPSFIKLGQTLRGWELLVGRMIKVRILPDELGRHAASGNGLVACQCRLWFQGQATAWQDVSVAPEFGGAFVYVRGAQDDSLIEVQIKLGNETWKSPAAAQWVQVEFSKAV
jgi:hypothetical protein